MNPCQARFLEAPHVPLVECILEITTTGIRVEAADGRLFWVSWEECQSAHKAGRIWRIGGMREKIPFSLLIDEESCFQEALQLWKNAHPHGFPSNTNPEDRLFWGKLALLVGGIAALVAILYFAFVNLYGVVPVSFDHRMGEILHSTSFQQKGICQDSSLHLFIRKAETALKLPSDRFPHPIHILPDSTVNAFAIPGGRIYVYRGLLAKSENPDELLGVIAHEMSHSELRHSIRQIWQGMAMALLLSMTFDPGAILEIANKLGSLKYSRDFEKEADIQAILRMQRAHLDPLHLENLLRRIAPSGNQMEIPLLSSHPLGEDRFRVIREATQRTGSVRDSLFQMERQNWNAIREPECK